MPHAAVVLLVRHVGRQRKAAPWVVVEPGHGHLLEPRVGRELVAVLAQDESPVPVEETTDAVELAGVQV